MTGVIEQLHEDAEIKIKIGKEEQTTPCSVGVKQGDNMAPFLVFVLDASTFRDVREKVEEKQRHNS
jgi:hypothetical protein